MSVFLKPDATYTWNGVRVNQYFMTAHNPNKISLPSKRSGDLLGVTLHNTNRIIVSDKTTPAEQYLRATINGNMGTVRVHLYVDSECAWLCLPLDYASWHAGESGRAEAHGSERGNGNTISIECIMNGSGDKEDIRARDNAARLVAYLLDLYGGKLYTHAYWINLRRGKRGEHDTLCTMKNSYKNCPAYIIPKWDMFKTLVSEYQSRYEGLYYVQVGAFSKEANARDYLKIVRETHPAAFIKQADLYYVQVGAFSSIANANAFLNKVKQDYPSAFIKFA